MPTTAKTFLLFPGLIPQTIVAPFPMLHPPSGTLFLFHRCYNFLILFVCLQDLTFHFTLSILAPHSFSSFWQPTFPGLPSSSFTPVSSLLWAAASIIYKERKEDNRESVVGYGNFILNTFVEILKLVIRLMMIIDETNLQSRFSLKKTSLSWKFY